MSVTSELKNEQSPLFTILDQTFSTLYFKLFEQNREVNRVDALRIPGANLMHVGGAFTYALALRFNPELDVRRQLPIVYAGASKSGTVEVLPMLISVRRDSPIAIASSAYLLKLMEGVTRGDRVDPLLTLFTNKQKTLRAAVGEDSVLQATLQDIAALIDAVPHFLASEFFGCVFGKTFEGSTLVGGGDAQAYNAALHKLVDARCTAAKQPFTKQHFYQQLAYVVLDTEEELNIEHLSWYYARQRIFFSYPIESLLVDIRRVREEIVEAYEIEDDDWYGDGDYLGFSEYDLLDDGIFGALRFRNTTRRLSGGNRRLPGGS